jgi:D-glycero-D-manno-heptose 1,7-bisphosphate phosphatase
VGVDPVKPRAVFLDRDGVLNRAVVRAGKPFPPASVDELEILPGAAGALARLKAAGYALVVVTNQPDIARGTTTRAAVDAIHARMASMLPIDEFRVCPHDDRDACACRKPRPGLLVDPPTNDVGASVMVGDRWRDIEAGRAAGCGATILIDHQYDEPIPNEPDVRVASLSEAAAWILTRHGRDD